MGSCTSCVAHMKEISDASSNTNANADANASDKEVPIAFVLPITEGYVIKVYDGDTITIQFKLPYRSSPLYKISVRLNGIDCPEMKSKNQVEKECAKIAKEKVSQLLLHQTVELKNLSMEKYGRLLAVVYFNGKNVNQWLVDNHLAVSYDGGTKISPENWMEYYHKITFKDF